MGPPSYKRSVVDRNVVIGAYLYNGCSVGMILLCFNATLTRHLLDVMFPNSFIQYSV